MDRSNLQRRLLRAGSAGALAVGLAAGGFGVASAASSTGSGSANGSAGASTSTPQSGTNPWGPGGPGGPGPGGRGPGGTITALGTNSITVQRPDGTSQTVDTTASTTYTRDGAASSASALATGEHVHIRPTAPPTSSASTVTAAAVDIMDPAIHGTVQSVSNGVLTIVDEQGFWRTVNLSASTTYTNNGQSATQSALTPGAKVVAFGSVDSNHTALDATTVAVNPTPPAGGHGGPPGGAGLGA